MTDTPIPERPKESGGGLRFNQGKMSFGLITTEAKVELARVYTIGALKYAPKNWEKGMDWSIMIECAERHWVKWQAGLTIDPETGCHHLALAVWNLVALLTYQMRGIGCDDRTILPIDEDFNWIGGPAGQLNIGLSPEKLKEMAEKYKPMRDAAIAKMKAEKGIP